MNDERAQKVHERIRRLASAFISENTNSTSLITVTNVDSHNRFRFVTIFVTILPVEAEKAALDFLKRNRTEFREYLKPRARLKEIPTFDFEIDLGEKNRQRIDEVSRNV